MLLDLVLIGPARWFEDHVDFLSVQSTLLGADKVSRWTRLKTHIIFYGNARDN